MRTETIRIWEEKEYSYEAAFGFLPNITAYLHEDHLKRPGIVVVPGGGYSAVSPAEGEPVARRFYEKGYQAFVLTYTTNLLQNAPLKLQPLHDISRAVRYIRKEAGHLNVQTDHLVVCGFSAGGHLCASLCVHYGDIHDGKKELEEISNLPDAVILAYPVITTGKYAHLDSIQTLLGNHATKQEWEYMSLENHVTEQIPPVFLWATVSDDLVPVENSIIFAEACRKKGIPCAMHIFSDGPHGLALADEEWAKADISAIYTLDQMKKVIDMLKKNNISFPPELEGAVKMEKADAGSRIPNKEVAVWPEMAQAFLENIWRQK